jgi:hypothetical protein
LTSHCTLISSTDLFLLHKISQYTDSVLTMSTGPPLTQCSRWAPVLHWLSPHCVRLENRCSPWGLSQWRTGAHREDWVSGGPVLIVRTESVEDWCSSWALSHVRFTNSMMNQLIEKSVLCHQCTMRCQINSVLNW